MKTGVLCPSCGGGGRKTISARKTLGGIRRRIECENGHRFTTIEVVMENNTLTSIRKFGAGFPIVIAEAMEPLKRHVGLR